MKNYYLKDGQVVQATFKEIGINWEQMHNLNASNLTKEERDYLLKYGLEPTIFNIANLRRTGYVHLPAYYKKLAIEKGAIDTTKKEEKPIITREQFFENTNEEETFAVFSSILERIKSSQGYYSMSFKEWEKQGGLNFSDKKIGKAIKKTLKTFKSENK